MIRDLSSFASEYGLKIHMGKTAVMTNVVSNRPAAIKCGQVVVKVVDVGGSERYLGRNVCFVDYHGVELANRIAAGWASFMKFKTILRNRNIPICQRIRLWDATVSPAVLYGCAAWTLTAQQEQLLKTTQRRMMRWTLGVVKLNGEEWPDFIKRSTHRSEEMFYKHGATDCVNRWRAAKWKYAGLCCRQTDGR